MRTKTPEQIYEQNKRIFYAGLEQYGRFNPIWWKRVEKIRELTLRYVDNIYNAAGLPDHKKSKDIERCNHIFQNVAFPASVYMKNH